MNAQDGSGYGRIGNLPDEDPTLTRVGLGTPMGELLRRYWQPVCLSSELDDLPKRIRVMGEDLVAFRDREGRAGLLYAHCIHRGASLEFGQVDDHGIRCCYHGWYFDAEGKCLDQPAEPPDSDYKDKVRQPWYPVQEYRGLVFAYMGPLDKKPDFPFFDMLERDGGDHIAYRNYTRGTVADCNWLQLQENGIDGWHTFVLHSWDRGVFNFTDAYSVRPELEFVSTGHGVQYIRDATLPNGNRFVRITEVIVPTARSVPPPTVDGDDPEGETEPARMVGWWVPIDDTHTMGFHIEFRPAGMRGAAYQPTEPYERDYVERQRRPDDWEAQVGQGPIVNHAREHLGVSDMGIVMFRRLLSDGIAAIARGEDPPGLQRDVENPVFEIGARNQVTAPDG
jgi:nitrite reductase/ring-hydroxylating ferredoxin subunit